MTVGGVSVLVRINFLNKLWQVYSKVVAETIKDLELHTFSCLVVQPSQCASVDPSFPRNVTDFQLALTQQASKVTPDHDFQLKILIS